MKHREQYLRAMRKALLRWQDCCYNFQFGIGSPSCLPPSSPYSFLSPWSVCYIQFKWFISDYNNSLLMPKVIQPRRHDKQLSAEDFWKIRDEGKQSRTPSAFHAFRETEVELRHRYQKPSDQAKAFNPLALTLRPRNAPDANNNMTDLTALRSEDQDTSIGEYLLSVQGKVHAAVYGIKKLSMGRQSVLYNLEKIYALLWENLHLEETWLLLQAAIRDSKGLHLSLWLQTGLKILAGAASTTCASCFNKPFFKNLFDTLCVLMEYYYDPILENIQEYFLEFAEVFMKHNNKYIRKFSVQAFSYLLGNLTEQQFDAFLNYLVGREGEGFFDSKLSLADLLLQRLKVVKGCLTTASLGHFLAQLQTLERSFQGKGEHFVPIAAEYIGLLLNSLNCKQGVQESQLLFDFLYVVKALTAFQEKHGPETYGPIFVRGFSNFLATHSTDRKKFSPHTSAQGHYLRQLWQVFGEYFSANTSYFHPREELNESIAALSINCGAVFLYNSAIIAYCKQNQAVTKAILRQIFLEDQVDAAVVEALLLLSREMLRRFVLEEGEMSDVYLLIILIKRSGMGKLVEISWLGLSEREICAKIERAELEDDLLVVLRLLAYVRIPEDTQQAVINTLSAVYAKTMTPYEQYLEEMWSGKTQGQLQGEDYFNCGNFPRELIVYAHHEIGWLSHVFNLYEAFSLLGHHLASPLPASPIWQQLITSRPSALALLAASNHSLISNLLSSRNREVRHSALTFILEQFHHPFSKQLLEWLVAIDREEIELSNEREAKRVFTSIQQHLQAMPEEFKETKEAEQLYAVLLKWCLGFAFTGFKLIQNVFISFLKMLLEGTMHAECPRLLQEHIMPFLHYYNYRHSRQYELDVSPQAPHSHLTNAFPLATPAQLRGMVREDLQVSAVETVEWIGLERIAQALRGSKQGKKHLAVALNSLVDAYFTHEFKRQANTIQSEHAAHPKPFLLPPKVRFLVTILKLCPGNYLPPFECLHFTREIFFQIESVRQIKRNPWEAMWEQRRGDQQPRRKTEVAELTSTTVNLQHLSAQEQRMYAAYLWKDILEGNRHKKRIIIDHLRNYLPTATPLLFQTLFQYLHLPSEEVFDEETVNRLVGRLRMMNRKSLLNGMFILKALLLHLRQEVGGSIKTILLFILSLIQIVYSPAQQQEEKPEDNQQDEEAEEEIEDKQQQQDHEGESQKQQEQSQQQGNADYFQYKQHRKQLQKLLQTLFANHDLQLDSITQLLEFLLTNTKINLAKSARLSVPGLLHILRILSGEKEYGGVMVSALNGEVVTMLTEMVRADEQNQRPLRACFEIWMQVMTALMMPTPDGPREDDARFQEVIDQQMSRHSSSLLSALITHINAGSSKHEPVVQNQKQLNKRRELQALSLMRLVVRLMGLQEDAPDQEWEGYIWEELGKLGKIKRNLTPQHCEKLSLLIVLLSSYIHLRSNSTLPHTTNSSVFLKKIITLLPSIRDPEQRQQVQHLMTSSCSQLGLSPVSVALVAKMGQIKKTALVVAMDFPAFFEACNDYNQTQFALIDHEYFLFNLQCFADHEELSVRRSVTHSCKSFLAAIEPAVSEEGNEWGREAVELVLKLYRSFLELLSKQSTHYNEHVFWNTVDNIDLFFTWLATHAGDIERLIPSSHAPLYAALLPKVSSEEEQSYFKLMGSLSEASKLKGLKLIRSTLQAVPAQSQSLLSEWSMGVQTAFPNPISKIMMPILEYLILKPLEQKNEGIKSNLSSTFAKQALELMPLLSAFLSLITVKRELKRLLSKLRFSETESKRNAAVVKMVGALIDGVPGERVSEKLHSFLQEHGFEQFHQKITQFSRSVATHAQMDHSDESDNQKDDPKALRRERIPGFYQHLEELESEEAINRNFMQFDRKLMELENQEDEGVEMFPAFLKKHVLLPLRTMLMKESSGKAEQEGNKSQVLLSVAITKVLLRLPLDLFLREFQKVVSRLGRLLKKREVQVRQNARNCLCQIARSVGPQLLYAIIIQLKFHLRDNFDKHVLNYSVFKVLDALELKGGAVDYCLPLILPSVVDEIFGQSSGEKEMVEKREVKTLKMEAKKQKGLDILQVVCRAISADRVAFIIEFLEKYLREHLVTEVSLGKYDHMLGAITAGLTHNAAALDPANASLLLPILAEPVGQLREQVRQLKWEDKPVHENTARGNWRRVKAGKDSVLTLQQQAGRNKSIFKKLSKEVGQRRNQEIIASSLIQFYLALLSFFLRRQVFSLSSVTATPALANHFITLLSFLSECVDQRDNRLVTKALKTLHIALAWNTASLKEELAGVGDRFKSIRKQTSRKILLLVQQLTLADEELLKECFVFLNDLVSESAVTLEMLPNFVSVIKLHTPTTDDQPHLPETYQLLRTLLFKCPQLLYHPLLDDLRLFVRNQLPTARNKELRDLAVSILGVYLRPRNVLEPSVEAFNRTEGRKGHVDYGRRLQEELSFYLSNLECPGQDAILQLLKEFIQHREPAEIETYGELLLLGLMTARTNQVGREKSHPTDELIVKVAQGINAGKMGGLVEKALIWMGQPRGNSIRLCGVSFLRILLQQAHLKLSQAFIERHVLPPGGLLERTEAVLREEWESLQANKQEGRKKVDNQWDEILKDMEAEEIKYVSDPAVVETLLLLGHLLSASDLPSAQSKALLPALRHCWQLLHSKEGELVQASISCLMQAPLLPVLHSMPVSDPKSPSSLRQTASALIFNRINVHSIEGLLLKLITEEQRLNVEHSHLNNLAWLLLGLGLKAHIKPNIYQQVLPDLLQLLLNLPLRKDCPESAFRSRILQQPNFQEKLLELAVKLTGNLLISFESRTLAQQVTEVLKEAMGVAEYFRAVGDYEVKKRSKREEDKARLAEMAILQPEEYVEMKRGKKRH